MSTSFNTQPKRRRKSSSRLEPITIPDLNVGNHNKRRKSTNSILTTATSTSRASSDNDLGISSSAWTDDADDDLPSAGPSQVPSPELRYSLSQFEAGASDAKPPYMLREIIRAAILDADDQQLTLNGVIAAVSSYFPYYANLKHNTVKNIFNTYTQVFYQSVRGNKARAGIYKVDISVSFSKQTTSRVVRRAQSFRKAVKTESILGNDSSGSDEELDTYIGARIYTSDGEGSEAGPSQTALPVKQRSFTAQPRNQSIQLTKRVFYYVEIDGLRLQRTRSDGVVRAIQLLALAGLHRSDIFKSIENLRETLNETEWCESKNQRSIDIWISLHAARKIAATYRLFPLLANILSLDLPYVDDKELLAKESKTFTCDLCGTEFQHAITAVAHEKDYFGSCIGVVPVYLADLNSSIRSKIRDGVENQSTDTSKKAKPPETSDFADSHVSPSHTLWTSIEKQRFFTALPRFSRLRPDLIAEHVRTKSTSQIVAYMAFLEQQMDYYGDENVEAACVIEEAREVSAEFIAFEEDQAAKIQRWEAYVEESRNLPEWQRTAGQQAFVEEGKLSPSCTNCLDSSSSSVCDSQWPVCSTCMTADRPCHYSHHPEKLIDATKLQALRKVDKEYAKCDLLRNLNWFHITVLDEAFTNYASLTGRLHLGIDTQAFSSDFRWSRFPDPQLSNPSEHKSLPHRFSDLLYTMGLDELEDSDKTRLFQQFRYKKGDDKAELPEQEEIDYLTILQRRQSDDQHYKGRKRNFRPMNWRNLPANSSMVYPRSYLHSQTQGIPYSIKQIKPELDFAKAQLALVGIQEDDLGEANLFNLSCLASMMDLYRYGTPDVAATEVGALKALYTGVKAFVSRIIHRAVTLADEGICMDQNSKDEFIDPYLYQAIDELHPSQTNSQYLKTVKERFSIPSSFPPKRQPTFRKWEDGQDENTPGAWVSQWIEFEESDNETEDDDDVAARAGRSQATAPPILTASSAVNWPHPTAYDNMLEAMDIDSAQSCSFQSHPSVISLPQLITPLSKSTSFPESDSQSDSTDAHEDAYYAQILEEEAEIDAMDQEEDRKYMDELLIKYHKSRKSSKFPSSIEDRLPPLRQPIPSSDEEDLDMDDMNIDEDDSMVADDEDSSDDESEDDLMRNLDDDEGRKVSKPPPSRPVSRQPSQSVRGRGRSTSRAREAPAKSRSASRKPKSRRPSQAAVLSAEFISTSDEDNAMDQD